MKQDFADGVMEYIDLIYEKLNELSIEDICYSDYDQITDWLGEIRKIVKLWKFPDCESAVKTSMGLCNGYCRSDNDDEPIDQCKTCKKYVNYDEQEV